MAYCHLCGRLFSSDGALQQHQRTSARHPRCQSCDRAFGSEAALIQHYSQSSTHHYCVECQKHFANENGLFQHYSNSPRHRDKFCRWCDEHFDTVSELGEHEEEVHWTCEYCEEICDTEEDLKEHKADAHWYCLSCDKIFNHENNLKQHLDSSIHKPRRYKCPASNCSKSFIDYGSMILHLESGGCRSRVTRAMIDKIAVQRDKHRVITDPAKLISYGGEWTPPAAITSYATAESFNGTAWECVLCHRTFRRLDSLNQHLDSAAHADGIYRCPQVFSGCGIHFNTLSGLVQHVEHSNCGVRRFGKQMRDVMDDVTSRMGRLSF